MSKYTCLVLGETGVGKSSFINAICKTNKCQVGNTVNACRVHDDIVGTKYNNNTFIFIDTPGLNDPKCDTENIKRIKNIIVENREFTCILILMTFHDLRLSHSVVDALKQYMSCFPIKDFWEHVIIIRTLAHKCSKRFEREKDEVKNAIVNSINSQQDFKDFKEFMNSKNISIPNSIKEFYVDCDNEDEPEDRFDYNKEEFDLIFNAIKNTPRMFKEIRYEDKQEITWKYGYDILITKRTIIYIDNNNNKIYGEPFVLKEKELDLRIIRKTRRTRVGTVEKRFFTKYVHMYYYERNVYTDEDGKEIYGNEYLVGDEWVQQWRTLLNIIFK